MGTVDQTLRLHHGATLVTPEYLDRASREMVENAGAKRITVDAFRTRVPFLADQIEADRGSPLLDYWGLSLNFDENAQQTIVHPKILAAIGVLCKRRIRFAPAYHAGLIHTYGYLLSTLQTPYGFKRDRWLKPTIENGLKLPRDTLRAEPKAGTLLQNLTYFLGRLVFRDSASRLRQLDAAASEVAPGLRTYSYDSLDVTRIVETCTVTGVARRRVSLVTELVQYPRRSMTRGTTSSSLLVYSLSDPEQGGMRLVTAFDVGPDMVAGLLADSGFGRRVSIRPRYNCYVPGFTGELPGSRRIA